MSVVPGDNCQQHYRPNARINESREDSRSQGYAAGALQMVSTLSPGKAQLVSLGDAFEGILHVPDLRVCCENKERAPATCSEQVTEQDRYEDYDSAIGIDLSIEKPGERAKEYRPAPRPRAGAPSPGA